MLSTLLLELSEHNVKRRSWEEKVPDEEVRERANMNSMFAMLSERRLRWLGHVKRMEPGRTPKDILYGELAEGKRKAGRPLLRYKDTCKRDLKLCGIDIDTWEKRANDRLAWRQAVRQGVRGAEENRREAAVQKRQNRKEGRSQPSQPSHMFAQSATETADRGSASSATHAVVNDSDTVPSSLADGRMPTTIYVCIYIFIKN